MSNVTVVEIREIARNLSVKGAAKLRKAELIVAIGDSLYDDAKAMDRERSIRKVVTRKLAKGALAAERMVARVNGYMRSNGTDKLTKAQQRRIRKNANRHGINPWNLSYTFP